MESRALERIRIWLREWGGKSEPIVGNSLKSGAEVPFIPPFISESECPSFFRSRRERTSQCMRARMRFSASALQYLQSSRMKTEE